MTNKEEDEIPNELLDLSSNEYMKDGKEGELEEENEESDEGVETQPCEADDINPLTPKALEIQSFQFQL